VIIDSSLRPELAPYGHLRAALNLANPVLASSHTSAESPAGVTIDLSRELARHLHVAVEFLECETPGDSLNAISGGRADVGFLAVDSLRSQQVFFTPPYIQIEACYLAPQASHLRAHSDVDRPGVNVLVMATSAYDLYLTRTLQHATLTRLPASEVLPALVRNRTGHCVAAGIKSALMADMRTTPGLRLLDGHFLAINQAIVLPLSSRPHTRAAISRFLAHMVDTGFISASLLRHGIEGATVMYAQSG